MNKPRQIVIDFAVCEDLGLSVMEYAVMASIERLSSQEKYKFWCVCSKPKLAKFLNVSESTIFRALDVLLDKELIKKNKDGHLRPTQKWQDLQYIEENDSEKNLPLSKCKGTPVKMTGNSVINNKEKNIKKRKPKLPDETAEFLQKFFISTTAQSKYVEWLVKEKNVKPENAEQIIMKFVAYWTEKDAKGVPRFLSQDRFQLKSRLVRFINPWDLSTESPQEAEKLLEELGIMYVEEDGKQMAYSVKLYEVGGRKEKRYERAPEHDKIS